MYLKENLLALIEATAASEFAGNSELDKILRSSLIAIVAAARAGHNFQPDEVKAAVIYMLGNAPALPEIIALLADPQSKQ